MYVLLGEPTLNSPSRLINTTGTKGKYRPEVTKIKPPFIVELRPMEIRTFNITVEYTV